MLPETPPAWFPADREQCPEKPAPVPQYPEPGARRHLSPPAPDQPVDGKPRRQQPRKQRLFA